MVDGFRNGLISETNAEIESHAILVNVILNYYHFSDSVWFQWFKFNKRKFAKNNLLDSEQNLHNFHDVDPTNIDSVDTLIMALKMLYRGPSSRLETLIEKIQQNKDSSPGTKIYVYSHSYTQTSTSILESTKLTRFESILVIDNDNSEGQFWAFIWGENKGASFASCAYANVSAVNPSVNGPLHQIYQNIFHARPSLTNPSKKTPFPYFFHLNFENGGHDSYGAFRVGIFDRKKMWVWSIYTTLLKTTIHFLWKNELF